MGGAILSKIVTAFFRNPYLATFDKYKYLLKNLIVRDLKVKYRRSTLGFLWSILNPLFMAFVLSAVFSNIMRVGGVENFTVFYLAGSLIFNFMNEATTGCMGSVIGAAPLIKKVYIPKYIFPAEKVLFAFVNMLFSMVALLIIMFITKIGLIGSAPDKLIINWVCLLFPIPMIYTFFFSLGLGLILAAYNVYFRDLTHLYSVLVAAWMYLTPIIYPVDLVKGTIVEHIMYANPMYYYVTYFRDVIMYGIIPDFNFNLICSTFSLAAFLIGILVFKKKQDRFILFI